MDPAVVIVLLTLVIAFLLFVTGFLKPDMIAMPAILRLSKDRLTEESGDVSDQR